MPTSEELIKSAAEFVEVTIPGVVRRFSDHDGTKYIEKYYGEYFAGGAHQYFGLMGVPSKYRIDTEVAENKARALRSEEVRDGRYRDYSLKVISNIDMDEGPDPRARLRAALTIAGQSQSDVDYVLIWDPHSKPPGWKIGSTTEAAVEPSHLAFMGVVRKALFAPSATSLHLLQRVLYFQHQFEARNFRLALVLAGKVRESPEEIARGILHGFLVGQDLYDETTTDYVTTNGRTDLVVRRHNIRWAIEVKTDYSADSLRSALRQRSKLDQATHEQVQKYHDAGLYSEVCVVLFYDAKREGKVGPVFGNLPGEESCVSVVCVNYGLP